MPRFFYLGTLPIISPLIEVGNLHFERPVHFNDVLATIYRQLGVATDEVFHNAFGQPVPILTRGKPVEEFSCPSGCLFTNKSRLFCLGS